MTELLVAAPFSGSGKTTVATGLIKLMSSMGLKTAAFKCGPDYVDPAFHSSVLGVDSYNLDLFLNSEEDIKAIYNKYSRCADVSVIEGVMGFYDGVGAVSTEASSYHTAKVTGVPVLLVLNVRGMGNTAAAVVKGMKDFRKDSGIKAVFLNNCTEKMYLLLKDVIYAETGVQVVGYLPKDDSYSFGSRELGLILPEEKAALNESLEKLCLAMKKGLDLPLFNEIFKSSRDFKNDSDLCESPKYTAAVAKDEAFSFIYKDNIDYLRNNGFKIKFFSPLKDSSLPKCDFLYLPGGYQHLYLKELSTNKAMKDSVYRAVKEDKLPVFAEGGGYMYLTESITNENNDTYKMCGVVSDECKKYSRLQNFGYAYMTSANKSDIFKFTGKIPVHNFSYYNDSGKAKDLVFTKPSGLVREGGVLSDNIMGGFFHISFRAADELFSSLKGYLDRL